MRIYLASSWRNSYHETCLTHLREAGHEVYDYRDNKGQSMNLGVLDWESMSAVLNSPRNADKFYEDVAALDWAEAVVLVMPSGRSAHLELGYAIGKSKITVVIWDNAEPELMHLMTDCIAEDVQNAINFLNQFTSLESREACLKRLKN